MMLTIQPYSRQSFDSTTLEPESLLIYNNQIKDYEEAQGIKFEITEKQNLFISLSDLSFDIDIYLCFAETKEDGQVYAMPYTNSTRHGTEIETLFAQLPPGSYYLVPKNNLKRITGEINGPGTITFDSKSFDDQLAELPDDPLINKQWYLFNTGLFSVLSDETIERLGATNLLDDREANGILPNADIRAPEAWKIKNSASNIVVAVIDQGVEIDHPDLQGNIWKNKEEIPGNGKDDDDNNYTDDVKGWNFGTKTNNPRPTAPNRAHGTHVAGTIGATANNGIGIAGVAWDVQLMPVSVEDPESPSGLKNVDEGVIYASKNGADIANLSLGDNFKINPAKVMTYMRANGTLTDDAPDLYQKILGKAFEAFSIAKKEDMMMVIAAGNDGSRADSLTTWGQIGNLDKTLSPWNFISGFYNNAMTIASSDGMNQLSPYTNTGLSVDLTAPGGNVESGNEYGILSTVPLGLTDYVTTYIRDLAELRGFDREDVDSWGPDLQRQFKTNFTENGDYGYMQGTSMATPVVSGAAALVKAVNPDFSANDVRQILIKSGRQNNLTKGIAGQNGLQLDLEAAIKLAEIWQGKKSFYELQEGDANNNIISSSPTNTWLKGHAGDDVLSGNKADDLIHGGAGKDLIIPGEGLDKINGGKGVDVIRYYHQDESPIARPDRILMDENDWIDLSILDGKPDKAGIQKLKFIGSSDFSGKPGQLMAKSNGFFVDLDGDSYADFGALFTKELDFEIAKHHFIL